MRVIRRVFSFVPPAILAIVLSAAPILHGADAVASSANATHPLGVGDRVPDTIVYSPTGAAVALHAALATRPTVLIFYRGSWCPYCNRHLAALGEIEAQLLALGYQILAISPDTLSGLRKVADKNHLNYQLFSDREMQASRAFGVAFRVADSTAQSYAKNGIELAPIPGEKGFWLPVPSVYLVAPDGTIRFAHTDPDFKARLASADIVAAAERLAKLTNGSSEAR
jgi:peroxiredoxin